MNGPKLTIDEQIKDMQNKGIKFEKIDEATAKKFLKNNNYYFKLKSYGKNNDNNYALWEIVEILSFGEFIDLYQLYYSKYPNSKEDYSSFLWSVKFLRNAATHNNCLLNSLKAPYNVTIHKTKEIQYELSKIKSISLKVREKWMNNPVIHDFIILVYVYLRVIKSSGIKQNGIDALHNLFEKRMLEHKDYFEKNQTIKESYSFVNKVVHYFCNKYRK